MMYCKNYEYLPQKKKKQILCENILIFFSRNVGILLNLNQVHFSF